MQVTFVTNATLNQVYNTLSQASVTSQLAQELSQPGGCRVCQRQLGPGVLALSWCRLSNALQGHSQG